MPTVAHDQETGRDVVAPPVPVPKSPGSGSRRLSDTIQEHLNACPPDLPGGTPQVHDFDGTFSLTDKGLKLTITSGEAPTKPTWWQSTLLAAGFYSLGLAFRTACMLGVVASTGGAASVLAKTACA